MHLFLHCEPIGVFYFTPVNGRATPKPVAAPRVPAPAPKVSYKLVCTLVSERCFDGSMRSRINL